MDIEDDLEQARMLVSRSLTPTNSQQCLSPCAALSRASRHRGHRSRGLRSFFSRCSGVREGFERRAIADQVPISVSIIDTIDRRPIFIDTESARGETGGFARIGVIPYADQILDRMRRIFQWIIQPIRLSLFDRARFFVNCEHRIAETVDFSFAFRLGWLDHQSACHGPTHRRRMEPAINQPFCDVIDGYSSAFRKRPDIDDTFMGNAPVAARVKDRIGLRQPRGDVIGVEDRDSRRLSEAAAAHQ